ncbi:MAG TPA: hypothetical protein VIJ04_03195 [Xanthobacteraceae bacterium]|jgi:hypothetical protein
MLLSSLDWLPLRIERRLALEGLLFQLIGVGVSAFVIGRLRRSFKLDPLLKSFLRYLADVRYVFIPRPPIKATASSAIGFATSIATAVAHAPPTGTTEERLRLVEKNVRDLQSALGAIRHSVGDVENRISNAIKQETLARDAGLTKIDNRLKETVVGDWQFAIVGLVYLFVGIILGTVPDEIAHLTQSLGFS